MSEGTDMPALPPELEELPQNETLQIPVSALATPDEKEQMVNPEPGDRVTAQVELEVVSVDGDQATVKISTVNGEALSEAAPEPAGPDMAGLQSEAEALGPMA